MALEYVPNWSRCRSRAEPSSSEPCPEGGTGGTPWVSHVDGLKAPQNNLLLAGDTLRPPASVAPNSSDESLDTSRSARHDPWCGGRDSLDVARRVKAAKTSPTPARPP